MKKLLKGTVTGLLLVTLVTPGFAENREGATTLSPYVGGYILDKEQPFESRPIFGLRAGYNFTENVGAELHFGYSLTETKRSYGSREADQYRYGGDILYHFLPASTLVPFVAVGGGVTNFYTPNTSRLPCSYIGQLNYGAGVKYFVAPDIALRGDVRHAILLDDPADHNLEYSVGLTFQFGGKRKAAAPVAVADVDTTKPTVIFTAPINGATNISINQKVNAAFSEDMDPDTLTGNTFTVKQGSTPVSGTVRSTATTATFTPTNYFEKDMTYTATITSGAKDLSGNALARDHQWAFTTGPASDTTGPTVIFTSPVNGATAAPINQNVQAAFSENMDPASISAATFTVKQGNTTVPGKLASSGSTATFTPAQNFETGKAYNATLTTGVTDLAGNGMAQNYQWNFIAAPKVLGVLSILENTHFEFDSAEVNENGKTILNHNSKSLKDNPNMKIRISGHTSASGTEEYNQDLSERRAESVRAYLAKSGINDNRLTTMGHGESNPAKYEADPSDKLSQAALANMRVVLEIIEK